MQRALLYPSARRIESPSTLERAPERRALVLCALWLHVGYVGGAIFVVGLLQLTGEVSAWLRMLALAFLGAWLALLGLWHARAGLDRAERTLSRTAARTHLDGGPGASRHERFDGPG